MRAILKSEIEMTVYYNGPIFRNEVVHGPKLLIKFGFKHHVYMVNYL